MTEQEILLKNPRTNDFYRLLKNNLFSVYSQGYSFLIIKALESGKIKITAPELFFNHNNLIESFEHFIFDKSFSLDLYIKKIAIFIKKFETLEVSYIPFSSFLIDMATLIDLGNVKKEEVIHCMDMLLLLIFTSEKPNPFSFRIFDSSLLKEISDINKNIYKDTVITFLNRLDLYKKLYSHKKINFPMIEVFHTVFSSMNDLRIQFLYDTFHVDSEIIKNYVESIPYWHTDNTYITVMLEYLQSLSDYKNDLKKVKKDLNNLLSYYNKLSSYDEFNWKQYLSNVGYKDIYVDKDFFSCSPFQSSLNISIDCSDRAFLRLGVETYIEYAYSLCNIKTKLNKKTNKNFAMKIIFDNVTELQPKVQEFLVKKREDLINRNFYRIEFEVRYNPDTANKYIPFEKEDHFLIISDIHYNDIRTENNDFRVHSGYSIFCGDTSDSPQESIAWIKANIKRGVLVNGESFSINSTNTLQENIRLLQKEFPLTGSIKYLNNNCIEYKDLIILGTCLYTNFEYLGLDKDILYPYLKRNIPEFKKTTVESINGKVRLLEPEDYVEYYNKSVCFLKEKLLEYKGSPIFIVSHFVPLPQSVRSNFKTNKIIPYYSNDLSSLLNENSNIRVWCHGHTHNPVWYTFNKTVIISQPRKIFSTAKILMGVHLSYDKIISGDYSNKKKSN